MEENILKTLSQETQDALDNMVRDGSFKHIMEAVSVLQYNTMFDMTDPEKVNEDNIQGYQMYFRGLMGVVEITEDVVNYKRSLQVENKEDLEPIDLKQNLMIQLKNKFNQLKEPFKK